MHGPKGRPRSCAPMLATLRPDEPVILASAHYKYSGQSAVSDLLTLVHCGAGSVSKVSVVDGQNTNTVIK
jgi:hypothetical protein